MWFKKKKQKMVFIRYFEDTSTRIYCPEDKAARFWELFDHCNDGAAGLYAWTEYTKSIFPDWTPHAYHAYNEQDYFLGEPESPKGGFVPYIVKLVRREEEV